MKHTRGSSVDDTSKKVMVVFEKAAVIFEQLLSYSFFSERIMSEAETRSFTNLLRNGGRQGKDLSSSSIGDF